MIIARSIAQLRDALSTTQTIGFVPTMGALHLGHRSLIDRARRDNGCVVVSIFVNPTQFLPGEDLSSYPRREEADLKICELSGVDVVFLPDTQSLYHHDEAMVHAPVVGGYILEGERRAGHFDGVLTIVLKLLMLVRPTRAYFGKKDAQQLALITRMVEQFFLDVEIIPCDTIREKEGLALSSRNLYLSASEREEALKLSRALHEATRLIVQGEVRVDRIDQAMRVIMGSWIPEYIAIVDRQFYPLQSIRPNDTIILIAARIGTTRLIDNVWV